MGVTYEHILGERQQFFVNAEGTAFTFAKPAAGDAMAVLTSSMNPGGPKRKDRRDAYQASRDTIERITGKTERSWSVDSYYVPSGTKNVAPDCGAFLEAMFGTETVGSNDVTYSQSSSQTLKTLTLVRFWQSWFMEAMWGAIPEMMSLKATGGDEPKIHFEGRAKGYAATGFSTLNGAVVASSTVIVQTADAQAFNENSVIQCGDQDNSGAGYQVTDASSTPSLTVETTLSEDNGEAVIPFVPTWTDAGVPITSISSTSSITWDSLSLVDVLTGFELTVKANNRYYDNLAFSQHMPDAAPGFFDITGKLDLLLRKDTLIKILDRRAFATKAVAVVMGGAAQSGTRLEIDLGQCELDFSEVSVPEEGEASISLPFKALGSSGNDAITWKHT